MSSVGSPPVNVAPASASSRMLLPHSRHQQLHQRRAESTSDQALDAAALQDRLMRRMKLDLGGVQPRAVVRLNDRVGGHSEGCRVPTRRRSNERTTERAHAAQSGQDVDDPNRMSGNSSADPANGGGCTAWTCQACSAENFTNCGRRQTSRSHHHTKSVTGQCCSVCLQPRRRHLTPAAQGEGLRMRVGDVVYGDDCSRGQEQLRQRRVTVTFAQIRGLEEPPEPTLTPGEWSIVEAKALARGDEAAPCPICREAFRGESQVILSCSHVFHKACLSSFENFVRVKEERSCPLCRKVDYQKRATRQGAMAWRQLCARRLQCAYRRHRARQQYRVLLRRQYAAGLGNTLRRREFLTRQAAEGAGKLAAALERREDSIDRLLGELDRSLAFSRHVFGHTSATAPVSAGSATISGAPGGSRGNADGNTRAADLSSEEPPGKEEKERLWTEAWRKAGDRGEDECPICMCPMEPILPGKENGGTNDNNDGYLTSSLL
ncbi:unnamed protein product, partial [Hapterophycus canaliculatus]